jgi:NTE family protein
VILSGGGAYAAYEIGVLRALCSGRSPATGYRPIDPRIVTGTSAGALNSALLVCHGKESALDAIDAIERTWFDDVIEGACGNGVFRWRGSPFNFFEPECFLTDPVAYLRERAEDVSFFSASLLERAVIVLQRTGEPLERRVLEVLNFSNLLDTTRFRSLVRRVVDFDAIRRSPRQLQIVATNWRTGEARVFDNHELDDEAGPLIIVGSCAIPGIFPPVEIPPEIFSDGGLVMNTPLSPPLSAGADVLHVVYMDPDVRSIPLSDLQTTLNTLQRSFSISVANVFNRDIENARNINRGIALLEDPALASDMPEREARRFISVAPVLRERLARGNPLRRVTIHRYHPGDLLGGALDVLSFEAPLVRKLIDRGFEDAVRHDCAAAGCVLADEGRRRGSGPPVRAARPPRRRRPGILPAPPSRKAPGRAPGRASGRASGGAR